MTGCWQVQEQEQSKSGGWQTQEQVQKQDHSRFPSPFPCPQHTLNFILCLCMVLEAVSQRQMFDTLLQCGCTSLRKLVTINQLRRLTPYGGKQNTQNGFDQVQLRLYKSGKIVSRHAPERAKKDFASGSFKVWCDADTLDPRPPIPDAAHSPMAEADVFMGHFLPEFSGTLQSFGMHKNGLEATVLKSPYGRGHQVGIFTIPTGQTMSSIDVGYC